MISSKETTENISLYGVENKMREKIQKELESTIASLKKLEVVKQHSYLGDELNHIGKRAKDNIFKLAVVGEFSSGKSTFINAIIGKDLLSHAVDETTAAITYIYNVDASDKRCGTCRVNYLNGKTETLEDYSKFAEYSTTHSSFAVVDVIKSIEIFVDFLQVKVPLVIVDTPGLNGVADKHKEITIEEVKKAHACIYVLSVKGITDSDVKFMKVLTKYQNFFIFVQNFIDTLKATEGETAESKKEKADEIIRKEFEEYENFEYKICAISALQALVSKDKAIEKLYAEDTEKLLDSQRDEFFVQSGFQDFEKILVEYMESGSYKKTILSSAVQALYSVIDSLLPGLYIQKEDNQELMKSDSKNLIIQKATARLQQIEEKSGLNRKKLKNFIVSRDKENREELKKGLEQDLENVYGNVSKRIDKEMEKFLDFGNSAKNQNSTIVNGRVLHLASGSGSGSNSNSNKKQGAGKYFSDIVLADINEKIIPNLNRDIKTGFQVVYNDALLRAEKYLGRMAGNEKIVIDSPDIETADNVNMRVLNKEEEIKKKQEQLNAERNRQPELNEKMEKIRGNQEQNKNEIEQEKRRYEREEADYSRQQKHLLGSKPEIKEKIIQKEREVPRTGFLHRIRDFFGRPKIETYYETVRDDSDLRRWEQEQRNLNSKIQMEQERYHEKLGRLEEKRNRFEKELRSSKEEVEKNKRRIERLQQDIKYEKEEYELWRKNAKKEFYDSQKKKFKNSFKQSILTGENSTLANLERHIDIASEENVPKITEAVIKNFDTNLEENKKRLHDAIHKNTEELEQEFLVQEKEIGKLEKLQNKLQKLMEEMENE